MENKKHVIPAQQQQPQQQQTRLDTSGFLR